MDNYYLFNLIKFKNHKVKYKQKYYYIVNKINKSQNYWVQVYIN